MATPKLNLPTTPNGATNVSAAYNPAMQVLDIAVQLAVLDWTLTAPPTVTAAANLGDSYVVAAGATGAWAGKAQQIAYCVGDDLWAFQAPTTAGWVARIIGGTDIGKTLAFDGSVWALSTLGGSLPASSVTYDNTTTGLTAVDAQAAIDELAADVADAVADVAAIDVRTSAVTALDIVSGVVNIDCALGNLFTLLLDENVTSITFSNLPAAGRGQAIAIRFRQDATGGRTVAWPSSFKALGGSDTTVPVAANAYAVMSLTTFDAGTRWEYALQEAA